MRSFIVFALILTGGLTSCDRKGIEEFSDNKVFLSFVADATVDSTVLSFRTYNEDRVSVEIPIRTKGKWLTENRAVSVSADPKLTTLPAELYELPEKCEFSAGQELDTITVTFLNDPRLAEKAYRFVLQIDESEEVKVAADVKYQRAIFQVSDKLERPKWWTELDGGYSGDPIFNVAEAYYLGSYSETKYIMFLEELAKDDIVFDGRDRLVLKKYSLRLKYRVEAFNNDPANQAAGLTPLKDEKGEKIVIPVVG